MLDKRPLTLFSSLLLLTLVSSGCGNRKEDDKIVIGIMQHAENPILDQVRVGFLDGIREGGLDSTKVRILYRNAQTSNQTNQIIAQQFIAQGVDLIFSIATSSSQAAKAATDEIPIVFGAISDPVSAGLAESLNRPGLNATGTSDVWPFERQFGLFKLIIPSITRIGVVHNPGESNSVYNMILTREAAQRHGIELVEAPVSTTSEVFLAAESIAPRCDAIYVPSDNTAITAAESIIRAGMRHGTPVFAGDTGTVESGAIATLGNNYYEIGKESGLMAIEILLEDQLPSEMPVRLAQNAELVINLSAATDFGISIPDSLITAADRIIE